MPPDRPAGGAAVQEERHRRRSRPLALFSTTSATPVRSQAHLATPAYRRSTTSRPPCSKLFFIDVSCFQM
ncbi:hypothetical protein BDA96_10G119700 [Sorghum bicolor]|uniref:Uncharacterized protein n=2 Tax=Sorghum bicolor TaxID=4558 RepID=A0A921U0M9_SORBI|nr:hypothetical protein BDA96_10G119700 [Sorghum bicolor]OQU76131.1 hypothetical protein SORBI_3010G098350 [Sorghum bicolor]